MRPASVMVVLWLTLRRLAPIMPATPLLRIGQRRKHAGGSRDEDNAQEGVHDGLMVRARQESVCTGYPNFVTICCRAVLDLQPVSVLPCGVINLCPYG